MPGGLLAHDEVLRSSIQARDGFCCSHTGDGVVAGFASPKSAVNAALAAQQALELPARTGLATGEAEVRGPISSTRCMAALPSRRVPFGSPTVVVHSGPGSPAGPPALGTSQPASDSPAARFQLTVPDS